MKARTPAAKTSKITINVWRPVWSKLEKKLDAACLKRDAYIASLINRELDYLQEEMPIANSEDAEKFVDRQLRALLDQNSTPLSIALPPEVAKKLERICSEKRIVRDSFFNRLFLFLAYGPAMAGTLLFRGIWVDNDKFDAWTRDVWREYKHDGPFFENVFEPFHAHQDPLWAVRACFELIEEQDKPEYVDHVDPETKQTVKMAKWVPDHLLHLPHRFYTAVLTDLDLPIAQSAPTRHASQGKPAGEKPARAFHNLYGLNCYLPNFHIRGHADQKAAKASVDELLADLG